MLRPDTEAAWHFLRAQTALAGFVLTGGSALALHLAHRQSEDLDFAWPGSQLPRRRMEAVRRAASNAGMSFTPHDDPAALREFADGGLDLLDFQQDYLMHGRVKVTFFSPEPASLAVLDPPSEPSTPSPRLASLAELFRSKAILSARRTRTRDAFDLHVLMTRCGFTLSDYHAAFSRGGIADQASVGLARLCSSVAAASDPGYETLAPNAPTRKALAKFFAEQRDQFERSEAGQAWRNRLRRREQDS
jgi:hypothetical protein